LIWGIRGDGLSPGFVLKQSHHPTYEQTKKRRGKSKNVARVWVRLGMGGSRADGGGLGEGTALSARGGDAG
jgi:hypothetical protein